MVIDPNARRTDGESVRIAKDVLCAGAQTKICLPDGPEEVERALARRGARRPVLVGDDRALLRMVELLHRRRELADAALSVVPIGGSATVALAHSLGVPTDAVAAARTVLDGTARPRDLLVDESGGVVLGGLRIPSGLAPHGAHDGLPGVGCGAAAGPDGMDGTEGTDGHGPGPHGDGARGRDCGCDPCVHDRRRAGDGEDGRGGAGPPGHDREAPARRAMATGRGGARRPEPPAPR
ncbi:hypothetical protein ABNG14_22495 [Streptomyces rapamycinicus]